VSTLWWPPSPTLLQQALPPLDELSDTLADHAPIEAGASLMGASDHHAKLEVNCANPYLLHREGEVQAQNLMLCYLERNSTQTSHVLLCSITRAKERRARISLQDNLTSVETLPMYL